MITVTLYDFLFLNRFQPHITYLVSWKDKDGKHIDVDFGVYNALTPILGAKLFNAPINKVEALCQNCYKIELDDVI